MTRDGEDFAKTKKNELEAVQVFVRRVEALRVSHERFFMGLLKIPPLPDRQKLERDLRNSPLMGSRNTALRFKFNNVRQRLASYARYWDRIMRLIEEGKFRRERNALSGTGAPAAAPPEPEAPETRSASDEAEARRVFAAWQEAHRELGKASKASFEDFASKLQAQRQRQVKAKGWKGVDFEVKVSEGKVRLVGRAVKEGR